MYVLVLQMFNLVAMQGMNNVKTCEMLPTSEFCHLPRLYYKMCSYLHTWLWTAFSHNSCSCTTAFSGANGRKCCIQTMSHISNSTLTTAPSHKHDKYFSSISPLLYTKYFLSHQYVFPSMCLLISALLQCTSLILMVQSVSLFMYYVV